MMSTYKLVRHNRYNKDLPQEEADAIERLRDGLKIKNWGPDLVIKAFRDLDTVFFRGRVVGNCLVCTFRSLFFLFCTDFWVLSHISRANRELVSSRDMSRLSRQYLY